jgi:hypothetical protein
MQLDLVKYLTERVAENETKAVNLGPVITISREYGCPSKNYCGQAGRGVIP